MLIRLHVRRDYLTSFTNHYEWRDLKTDPLKLLEKYFDAFLYVANWGTRELYLRLPQESAAKRYAVELEESA